MAYIICSLDRLRASPRSPKKLASAIVRADLASILATKKAALFVRTIERTAFVRKVASNRADTQGRVWAVTAGISRPANCNTRSGSLPEVRKIAVEVTRNPIAKMAARSKMERSALSPVSKYHFMRSLGDIKAKLAMIALSISQV
jgi:hypothetical protein